MLGKVFDLVSVACWLDARLRRLLIIEAVWLFFGAVFLLAFVARVTSQLYTRVYVTPQWWQSLP